MTWLLHLPGSQPDIRIPKFCHKALNHIIQARDNGETKRQVNKISFICPDVIAPYIICKKTSVYFLDVLDGLWQIKAFRKMGSKFSQ